LGTGGETTAYNFASDSAGEGLEQHALPLVDMETGTTHEVTVVCGYNQTDVGNAQRLIAYYGDVIRFCAELDTWFIWDGIRWAPDTTLLIRELAKNTARLIHSEIRFVDEGNLKETKQVCRALTKWAYQSEANFRINAMNKLAQSDPRVAVKASDFDAKTELMNFPNGTLNFARREFREHRREDLLTKLTGAAYDPSRECKQFYQTLCEALPPEQIVYLQRMLGSMLEATTQNKEFLIIYGKPYARKSSVTQSVYAALGDYAKPIDISLLTKSKHGVASNAARPDLMALEGVRIAWSEETPEGMVFDESMLKGLTSSGKKAARNLFEKQRELELQASFVIETNNPPTIDITDEWQRDAFLERTCVVQFLNQVPKEARDPDVLKHLTHDEDELTAALAWVVQGYFDRLDYGLDVPESIKDTSEEFQTAINPLIVFVKNEVLFDDGTKDGEIHSEVRTYVSDLYQQFQETADPETLKQVRNARSFNIHFGKIAPYYAKKAGVDIRSHKYASGSAWHNVRLAEIDDDPEVDASNKQEDGETCSHDDANVTKVTQNGDLVKPITTLAQLYRDFDQNGFLRHRPTFPTILIDGLEPLELDFPTIEERSDEIGNYDAKFTNSVKPNVLPAVQHPDLHALLPLIRGILLSAKDAGPRIGNNKEQLAEATAIKIKQQYPEWRDYDVLGFFKKLAEVDPEIQGLIADLTAGVKL
jgi:putative DNA primase/helicase